MITLRKRVNCFFTILFKYPAGAQRSEILALGWGANDWGGRIGMTGDDRGVQIATQRRVEWGCERRRWEGRGD